MHAEGRDVHQQTPLPDLPHGTSTLYSAHPLLHCPYWQRPGQLHSVGVPSQPQTPRPHLPAVCQRSGLLPPLPQRPPPSGRLLGLHQLCPPEPASAVPDTSAAGDGRQGQRGGVCGLGEKGSTNTSRKLEQAQFLIYL